jgi:hypothetical protein
MYLPAWRVSPSGLFVVVYHQRATVAASGRWVGSGRACFAVKLTGPCAKIHCPCRRTLVIISPPSNRRGFFSDGQAQTSATVLPGGGAVRQLWNKQNLFFRPGPNRCRASATTRQWLEHAHAPITIEPLWVNLIIVGIVDQHLAPRAVSRRSACAASRPMSCNRLPAVPPVRLDRLSITPCCSSKSRCSRSSLPA